MGPQELNGYSNLLSTSFGSMRIIELLGVRLEYLLLLIEYYTEG